MFGALAVNSGVSKNGAMPATLGVWQLPHATIALMR
jgi:hypothetical protein